MREINKQKSTGMPDMGQMLVEMLHRGVRFGFETGHNNDEKVAKALLVDPRRRHKVYQ